MNRLPTTLTVGQTATLLGLSIKALRVYERHGLVRPDRSAAGYRVYGPQQLRRLHQVIALKSLGLTLAQIGACLSGLGDRLRPILEAQERDLRARLSTLQTAATAVAAAQARLDAGETLSVDDLVTLSQEIVMTRGNPNWRDNLATLFAAHFTTSEREALMPPAHQTEPKAEDAREREALLAEATALIGQDPGCPAALDLARRWRARAMAFAGDDPAMLARVRAVLDNALANPEIAATLPWRAELAFIKAATQRLENEGL